MTHAFHSPLRALGGRALRLGAFSAPLFAVPFVFVSTVGCTSAVDEHPASADLPPPVAVMQEPSEPVGDLEGGGFEVPTVASSGLAPAPTEAPPAPSLLSLEALAHEERGHDFVAEGDALTEAGRAGEALIAYRHALYSDDSAEVWERLGAAYARSGEGDRSLAAYQQSLQKRESASVRRSLARLHLQRKEGEQARAHAETLVKVSPSGRHHYLLGRTYLQTAMWQEAITAFEKSLDDQPGDVFAHNNLGFAALQLGENELALTHLEHTLDLTPVKPYMLNNLGVAYERLDRGPEALAAFSYAAELAPRYVKAKVNQSRVSMILDEEDQQLSAAILEDMKTPTEEAATAMMGPVEEQEQ